MCLASNVSSSPLPLFVFVFCLLLCIGLLFIVAELQEFSVYSGPQPLVRYVTCTHALPPGGDFSPWRQCPLMVVVFHCGEVHPIHLFLLLLPVRLVPHPRSHCRPQGHDDASPGTGPAELARFCLPCASSSFPPDFAHSVLEGVWVSWHHRLSSLAFHCRGAVATADPLLFTPFNASLSFRGSWLRGSAGRGTPAAFSPFRASAFDWRLPWFSVRGRATTCPSPFREKPAPSCTSVGILVNVLIFFLI